MKKWKKVFTPKGYNHHFWLNQEDNDRLTLADNSSDGGNPERTDDGPLYLDGNTLTAVACRYFGCGIAFDVRVTKEDGEECKCSVDIECAEYLVREQGFHVLIKDKKVKRLFNLFKSIEGGVLC